MSLHCTNVCLVKRIFAVEIGTGGLRLQNYQSFRKLQNRGFIGVIKVCQVNLGFIKSYETKSWVTYSKSVQGALIDHWP